jgi:chromosome segregation ATPase
VHHVVVQPARLLGLTNHEETQQRRAGLEAEVAAAQEAVQRLEGELQRNRGEQESATVARDEQRHACRKLKQLLTQPEAMKTTLLREEKRRDELSRKLQRDSGTERERLVGVLRSKVTELLESVSEIHMRCDTALEATIWKEYTSRASRSVQAELFAAREAKEEARARFSDLKILVKTLERERNIAKDEKLDAEGVISQMEEKVGSEEALSDYFIRASKEITETTREALMAKREQLSGQLEAIVDNPELVTQYENLRADVEKVKQEHDEKKRELDNLEESMLQREEQWKTLVSIMAQKLNTDFSRFMKELHFDGEIRLVNEGGFMDHSVEMMVNFRSDGQSGMQVLSGLSHSGGERSVSTVM